ncbi:hypothetical protein ACFY05_39535 [Microtetraspora fusca]|uniref:Uncharacterized protein n=1 Tax=Microtetraspora fusca TaxID=1997 RepID=A0ABW6VHU8_MICFU
MRRSQTFTGVEGAERRGARTGAKAQRSGLREGQILNTGADFYTGTLFADMDAPEPGSLDALMAASHGRTAGVLPKEAALASASTGGSGNRPSKTQAGGTRL